MLHLPSLLSSFFLRASEVISAAIQKTIIMYHAAEEVNECILNNSINDILNGMTITISLDCALYITA